MMWLYWRRPWLNISDGAIQRIWMTNCRRTKPSLRVLLEDLRDATDVDGPPLDAKTLASLDRGLADIAAGRVKPLNEYKRERGL
jgi:hypothetical protein